MGRPALALRQHNLQLLLLLCLLLLELWCAADETSFCLRSVSTPDASLFVRGSRHMPPRAPALAAFDWVGGAADQQQMTASYKPCHAEAPVFRYKVAKGVVYVDHDHTDARYKPYRDGFLEQLVLVSAAAGCQCCSCSCSCTCQDSCAFIPTVKIF
jgi:hypothetical protein